MAVELTENRRQGSTVLINILRGSRIDERRDEQIFRLMQKVSKSYNIVPGEFPDGNIVYLVISCLCHTETHFYTPTSARNCK